MHIGNISDFFLLSVPHLTMPDINIGSYMRSLFLLLILVYGSNVFGQQNIDSLFTQKDFPSAVDVAIKKESGKLTGFPSNYVSIVTFSAEKTSVYYFIFDYDFTDNDAFKAAESNYWMISGCNSLLHKKPESNYRSFSKGGYYFLLQQCACKTRADKKCAVLAR